MRLRLLSWSREFLLLLYSVICTQLPEGLRRAAKARDERGIEYELAGWEPVIPITLASDSLFIGWRCFIEW